MLLNISYILLEVDAKEYLLIEEEEVEVLIIVTIEIILNLKRSYTRVLLE